MARIQIFLPEGEPVTHDLTEDKQTIGRLADNNIHIDDGLVSSRHAELVFEKGHYHLHDLGSTNGTFVNNEQVTDAVLRIGDQVRFGRVEAAFVGEIAQNDSSVPLPETEHIALEVSKQSSRPADFVNTSPFTEAPKTIDPLSIAAIAIGVLGFVSFAAAVCLALMMHAPSF